MSRFAKAAMAGLLMVPAIAFAGTAYAQAGDPQIERGDIYRVKNTTNGGDFVDTTSAKPGDSLTYKVRIHNPGEECLTNVTVKFVLPSSVSAKNVSTVTVRADEATTNFVSDTATVELSSAQKISFVPGSVQLLDPNGSVLSTLSDGAVNGSGVNIGSVCVSINEKRFVQFQAKVNKPEQPEQPEQPEEEKPVVKPAVTELPKTGAGTAVGIFAGASALGAAGHYVVRRIRN